MSVFLSEKFVSRSVSFNGEQTETRVYDCIGDDDENNVLATLLAETVVTYTTTSGTMRRKDVAMGEHKGPLIWGASVTYQQVVPDDLSSGDGVSFAFEIGGGTAHINYSKAVVMAYAPSGVTAPDAKQAIGATLDGIEGCDVFTPSYNFTETYRWNPEVVTGPYKAAIFALCAAPVNNASFRGFAAGEVLFTGASGSKTGPNEWEISYKFSALPNVTNLQVGDITGITKKGWDYLEIRFKTVDDGTPPVTLQVPAYAIVHQVYGYGDFSTLGICTT